MKKIRNVYDLKAAYEKAYPGTRLFDKETLKRLGESLDTMHVLKDTEWYTDVYGEEHECIVLSRIQFKHPCGPRKTYAYFDKDTLRYII